MPPETASRSRFFPPPDSADEMGVVAIGGELSTERLLDAYRHGIFPWPLVDDESYLLWWSPDPRAVFELEPIRIPSGTVPILRGAPTAGGHHPQDGLQSKLGPNKMGLSPSPRRHSDAPSDGFYVSRRLARTCRGGRFVVTANRDFAGVMRGCATAGDRSGNTWITEEMIAAYARLNALGHAHSIEVWHDGLLAGGTYGVAIGGLFAAESMFFRVRDASKVALVHLVGHLRRQGYRLFDIQQLTEHTQSLGAVEIPRLVYLKQLREAVRSPVEFGRFDAVAALAEMVVQ